ncbi:ATP-grasp domain-containing protein [Pararhizobium sp. BT-229]|uniref:ATP-grasp domain-containing protein n=1 Tax=Pararhizobium sp. BT-229 TaxID=2986923 RepID=UPI0021F7D592|nr:ATP-grasp domain-containing protein [Pararhizobium sp. BT-229]MCV9964630.1 ATP-grasp domain-containing protein [Pararhizobium sp. BT-229]
MTVFVLQNNSLDRIGRLVMPCVDYCARHGLEFVDRSLTVDLDVDRLDIDESGGLLVYGSVGWAKRFKESRFGRWIDYDEDAFAASTWGPLLGERALNGRGEFMTVLEVSRRLASGGRLHLRPDRNDKAFAGGVFDAATWGEMLAERRSSFGVTLDDITCWASVAQPIDGEVRCWFVAGELVEASRYRRDGALVVERVEDPGVMKVAAELGGCYLPIDNAVMDIAFQGGDAYVLEYNKIHSAGWYAADVDRVLDGWVADLRSRAVSRPGISPSTASM